MPAPPHRFPAFDLCCSSPVEGHAWGLDPWWSLGHASKVEVTATSFTHLGGALPPFFAGAREVNNFKTWGLKKVLSPLCRMSSSWKPDLFYTPLETSWNHSFSQLPNGPKDMRAEHAYGGHSPLNDPSLLIRSRFTVTTGPWRSNGKGSNCHQCCADDRLTLRWGLSIFLHLRVASGLLTIHATSSVTSIYIMYEKLNLISQRYTLPYPIL